MEISKISANIKMKLTDGDIKKASKKQWIMGFFFALPALAFTLIFDYYPLFNGIYHSLFTWNGADVERYVGIGNFTQILQDSIFWLSVKNMLFFLFWGIALMIPTIIATVVLFHIKNLKAQYFYRIIFCLPMVVPGMVIMLLWQFMYNPQFGFFNQFLSVIGLDNFKQLWLGNESLVKWCLVFMNFPWINTLSALIYLGGLQSLDSAIWDAADLDGASPIVRFLKIELPLLKGQIKINIIGVIAGGVTGYGAQLIMTNGGPGFASLVPGLYMYNKAFGNTGVQDYGLASAVGLILFVIAFLITIFTMKFVRSED